MSFQNARGITYTATAAIPQGRFVVSGANGQVTLAGANAEAIGVSLEAAAAAGDAISVAALDGAKVEVEAGAAIDVSSAAQDITSDASGRAVVAGTGERILGYALSSAGAAAEFITATVQKGAIAAA